MKNFFLISLIFIFVFFSSIVSAQTCGDSACEVGEDFSTCPGDCHCGNSQIDIFYGEACDPGVNGVSDSSNPNSDDFFPLELDSDNSGEYTCSDVIDQASGGLGCYGNTDAPPTSQPCQLDVSQCNFELVGIECSTCDQCDDVFGGTCPQNLCVNYCSERGNCYYDPPFFNPLEEDCKTCGEVISCSWYMNELDCNGDVCNLLIDSALHPDCGRCSDGTQCDEDIDCSVGTCDFGDVTGLTNCRVQGEQTYACIWTDGACQPNWACSWDCDDLYGDCVNGERKKNLEGDCDYLGNDDRYLTGECANPAAGYPPQIACNVFDEDFPIFDFFNIFTIMVLLTGYYTIKRFKNNRNINN